MVVECQAHVEELRLNLETTVYMSFGIYGTVWNSLPKTVVDTAALHLTALKSRLNSPVLPGL